MDPLASPTSDGHTKIVTVLVDSRDRDPERFPHTHDYSVRLPEPLYAVQQARLVSAELPSSFYVFKHAFFNTTICVVLRETDASSGIATDTTKNVRILDGNYSFSTMASELADRLEEAFEYRVSFTVEFQMHTHRCLVRCVHKQEGVSAEFRFDTSAFDPYEIEHRPLAYYLGFSIGPATCDDWSEQGTLIGARPSSLNPEMYILLDIEEIGRLRETAIQGQGGRESGTTFAKIPLASDSFQYTLFDKTITHNFIDPPIVTLDRLRIRWRFHDRTPVDFHGLDHSLTIELVCGRRMPA